MNAEPVNDATPDLPERFNRKEVNRFVSALAAAYRAIQLYRTDHKTLDEIMQNTISRFQAITLTGKPLHLMITFRSLFFEGQAAGTNDVSAPLANLLLSLGYKEIYFRSPLNRLQFSQFLTIITSKDSYEAKNERLVGFIEDGEEKSVSLVPLTTRSLTLQLPDELIRKKLAPVLLPKDQGGSGFIELLSQTEFKNLPDLYTWLCAKAEILPGPCCIFLRNVTDVCREGFLSTDRFSNMLPWPSSVKKLFSESTPALNAFERREKPGLGQSFRPAQRSKPARRSLANNLVYFSEDQSKAQREAHQQASQPTATQEFELAKTLMTDQAGTGFVLGFSLLIRILSEPNTSAIQEQAVQLATAVWTKTRGVSNDPRIMSMLSVLRQHFTSVANVNLTLFPVRTAAIDSDVFLKVTDHFISLGDAALPPLFKALEIEVDRSMRKKLCQIITLVAKKWGDQFLVDSIATAAPFLARNIMMILGDLRSEKAVPKLAELINSSQKILRAEAIRSLCKIGAENVIEIAEKILNQSSDLEQKQIALTYIVSKRNSPSVPTLIRLAQDNKASRPWKRSLYMAMGTIGGDQAFEFLISIQKGASVITFNSEDREDQALIKTILNQVKR